MGIYDLYQLEQKGVLDETFYLLIEEIIKHDAKQYHTHNPNYALNPFNEIQFSLDQLAIDPTWQNNWQHFVDAMVFRQQAPVYQTALSVLERLSQRIMSHVNN